MVMFPWLNSLFGKLWWDPMDWIPGLVPLFYVDRFSVEKSFGKLAMWKNRERFPPKETMIYNW